VCFGHLGGNIAIASTSNNAPGRASCGTPIVVLTGGVAHVAVVGEVRADIDDIVVELDDLLKAGADRSQRPP